MSKRIKVDDLPEFDAAQYLDNDATIAAYLTDILEAKDAGPAGRRARRHCPCSRHNRNRQVGWHHTRSLVQGFAPGQRTAFRYG